MNRFSFIQRLIFVALLSMLLAASLYAVTPDDKISNTWSSIKQGSSFSAAPGIPVGPVIVSPTSLDFGRIPKNTKVVKYLTIKNAGARPVNIPFSGIPSVPMGGFSTRVNSPFPVPANSTQNFMVVFNPQSAKTYIGEIKFIIPMSYPVSVGNLRTVTVTLKGTGY